MVADSVMFSGSKSVVVMSFDVSRCGMLSLYSSGTPASTVILYSLASSREMF